MLSMKKQDTIKQKSAFDSRNIKYQKHYQFSYSWQMLLINENKISFCWAPLTTPLISKPQAQKNTLINTRLHKPALHFLISGHGHATIQRESNLHELQLNQSSFTSVHSWYCANFVLLSTLHKRKRKCLANLPMQIFVVENLQPFRNAKPTKDWGYVIRVKSMLI